MVETMTEIERQEKKDKTIRIVKLVLIYTFLTICALLAFLPFYWMIITSVKTEAEYRQSVPTFFPHTFMFKNYSYVLTEGNNGLFGQMLLNTIVIGIFSTIAGVIITILTAYAFAKINFKGKNVLFTIMLATMMIPGELYTITNYVTVSKLNWNDTFIALIVPFLVSTYYIYLLRNTFKQIPNELYYAAKVDGTSDLKYLFKVMIPIASPTIITITILKMMGAWNSYIWPNLVTEGDMRLITNGLRQAFSSDQETTHLKMAATTVVTVPLLLIFIFFRKYIMKGVSRSGIKG